MEVLTQSLNILTSAIGNSNETTQQKDETDKTSDKAVKDDASNSKYDIDKNEIKDDNSQAPSNCVNNLDDENQKEENLNENNTNQDQEKNNSPAKLDTSVLNKLFDTNNDEETNQENQTTQNENQSTETVVPSTEDQKNEGNEDQNTDSINTNESNQISKEPPKEDNQETVETDKPKELGEISNQVQSILNIIMPNEQAKTDQKDENQQAMNESKEDENQQTKNESKEVQNLSSPVTTEQPLTNTVAKNHHFKDDSSYTSSYSEDDEPFKQILNNNNLNTLLTDTNNTTTNTVSSPKSPTGNTSTKGTTHFVPTMSTQPEEDDGIPPALKPHIYHSKDSLTYRALCGEQLHGLTQSALTSIVNDLRKYVDIAVDHNLIEEACHVQECIDNIRNDRSAEQMQTDKEIIDIDRRIQEARIELEERENFWNNQEYTVQKEFEMQLSDLMINKEQALSDLDNEWQSSKKQQQYSKPSPALLNMRHMAKKMIKSKQFKDVKQLAHLIEEKEQQEISDAMKRMNEDYHLADQRVNEHYDHEQQVIESMHEMKMHSIIRSRNVNLRPINQRIENLEKLKEQAIKRRTAQNTPSTTPRNTSRLNTSRLAKSSLSTGRPGTKSSSRPGTASRTATLNSKSKQRTSETPQKQLPQLLVTPKLALQPVKRIKRDTAKTTVIQQSPSQQQRTSYTRNLSSLSNNNSGRNSSRRNNLTASPLH